MTSPDPQTQQPQQPASPLAEPPTEKAGTPEAQQAPPEHAEKKRTGGKVLQLRTAHPRIPIPYVAPGDMFSSARKATPAPKAASLLPSPRRLAFYGVLGAMAVVEAVEWPIAVAVGAATEVITREQAAGHRQGHERTDRERDQEPAGRTETATPQTATPQTATA